MRTTAPAKHFAIVGAGMAGIVCARTLVQAGQQVTVFEKSASVGGRMATRASAFGSFDHGAQYFTARNADFLTALATTPTLCKRWSANQVPWLDELGHSTVARTTPMESHWVGVPGMQALVAGWAEPLRESGRLQLQTRVNLLARDATQWQLHSDAAQDKQQVFRGFDAVLLAMPAAQTQKLLQLSELAKPWVKRLDAVQVAPCWTLMLAFPQAMQPGLTTLGPQWNAARSSHHRIAWLARESSKPGRSAIERWTVQASPAWSQEHLTDDAARVEAKLLRAFAEVTGIRALPAQLETHFWRYAKTLQPLGKSHLWDAKEGLGVSGDWCLGHRLEDAFVSGLALAQALL